VSERARAQATQGPPSRAFLARSPVIDLDEPGVAGLAAALARQASSERELVRLCFEHVRDQIQHSSDFRRNPVTCRASDVLRHGTGFCYAKSHLLAALLRANGVPAGFCYQRLSVGDAGPPYCLHGLNAVYLGDHGWYRVDARGNRPGIDARFTPPIEALAFPVREPDERDLDGVWPEPLPVVIDVLSRHATYDLVLANLPDLPLRGARKPGAPRPQ